MGGAYLTRIRGGFSVQPQSNPRCGDDLRGSSQGVGGESEGYSTKGRGLYGSSPVNDGRAPPHIVPVQQEHRRKGPTHQGSDRSGRETPIGTRVAVVNDSQEGGHDPRSTRSPALVQGRLSPRPHQQAPALDVAVESLRQEDEGGGAKPTTPNHSGGSRENTTTRRKETPPRGGRNPVGVANSSAPRVRFAVGNLRRDLREGEAGDRLQKGQGSQSTRPIYGGHPPPERQLEGALGAIQQQQEGPEIVPTDATRQRVMLDPPSYECSIGAAQRSKGGSTNYGEEQHRRGNIDAIFWSHSDEDVKTISELELCEFEGPGGHAGSRKATGPAPAGKKKVVLPSWSALKNYTPDAADFPLHHKDDSFIATVSYNRLKSLPTKTDRKTDLLRALNWVCNPEHYTQFSKRLPRFRRYKTRLFKEDVKILYASKKLFKIRPRNSVRSFFVVEWHKKRRRPIFWPDINEAIGKKDLAPSTIPLKKTIRRNCLSGQWAVQFDFVGWYDQLPLHRDISKYFAFDGKYCLRTLPMGFRPACEVAQAISLALADFSLPEGVSVDVYIDNIRFVGDKDRVMEAGRNFVDRCKKVGAILDCTTPCPKQEDDFLGEHYDYVKRTRKLTTKTLDKLRFVHSDLLCRDSLSNRQVAAVFGLLFFSADVLALPLCHLHSITKWYRKKMSDVKDQWDATIVFPSLVRDEILQWVDKMLQNEAVPICPPNDELPTDLTLMVDACDIGWGCVSSTDSGTQLFSGKWTAEDQKKHQLDCGSVATEPLGAWRSIVQCVAPTLHKKVVVYTDHLPLVWATQRGYAHADSYNELICRLRHYYPDVKFEFRFIPGAQNITADGLSRGWI